MYSEKSYRINIRLKIESIATTANRSDPIYRKLDHLLSILVVTAAILTFFGKTLIGNDTRT